MLLSFPSPAALNLSTHIVQAPEIQITYGINKSIAEIRTKMRQEFEKHRFVSQLPVVDMLLFQSDAEFQVSSCSFLNRLFLHILFRLTLSSECQGAAIGIVMALARLRE
jgi:hypothetical protein